MELSTGWTSLSSGGADRLVHGRLAKSRIFGCQRLARDLPLLGGIRVQWPSVQQQIAAYLLRHPEAEDTLEGIVEWWLLEQRIRTSIRDVQSALRELDELGFLVAGKGPDGQVHYGLDASKRDAVLEWLTRRQPAVVRPGTKHDPDTGT